MIYRTLIAALIAALGLSGCVYDGHYGNAFSPDYAHQSSHSRPASSTTYIYHDDRYEASAHSNGYSSYGDDHSHLRKYEFEQQEPREKKLSKRERKRKEQQDRDLAFINEKLDQLERAGERFGFKKPSDF